MFSWFLVRTIFRILVKWSTVVSYQNESFSSKWELPCLPPSFLELWRKERARRQLSFWWKNSHFNRTLRYVNANILPQILYYYHKSEMRLIRTTFRSVSRKPTFLHHWKEHLIAQLLSPTWLCLSHLIWFRRWSKTTMVSLWLQKTTFRYRLGSALQRDLYVIRVFPSNVKETFMSYWYRKRPLCVN